jgi:hypothetical protein
MASRIEEAYKNEQNLPTYLDIKNAEGSKIFEAADVMGSTPDQIKEAERVYEEIIKKLEAGEDIDEGLLSGLAGGAIGALAGPTVGKAICKVLGIDPKGTLGKLLTSRLVSTALGYALGK